CLSAGTTRRRFLAVIAAVPVEQRPSAVEESQIIIDRINLVVVHDRETDIPPVEPARGEGLLYRRAFGELHGGGVVDLRAVEIDFVLTELHVKQREVCTEDIVVQEIG